jgi:2-polyprenyl-3-methyl-5-hydroxy-6-metoxy-1,4-benzoquinol methylase
MVLEEYNLKFRDYIREGVKKYNGLFPDPFLPPVLISFPKVFINSKLEKRTKSFFNGKIKIHEGSPEYKVILKILSKIKREGKNKISLLDIGCGDCGLADYLNSFDIDIEYEGVDISQIDTKFKIYNNLSEIKKRYDVIIMAHVAEHMHYEDYLNNFQYKIKKLLDDKGVFILATPNPICLKSQFCDITHIQIYPWHNAYAILRINFREIDVIRGVHLTKLLDIAFYPLKVFLSKLIGIDYAGSLIYICKP